MATNTPLSNSQTINTTIVYDQYSRLRQFPVIYDTVNNVNRLGNKNYNLINTIKANVPYNQWKITVQYQYRPDSIAYLFYGNSELWWVLTGYNNFYNGPSDFYVNRVIFVPVANGVFSVLMA